MCKFFSLVSDGKDKIMYFDSVVRKKILAKELNYELDSHTSIADCYGYKGEREDKLNKYEYNPLTKTFQVDQLNTDDDSEKVKEFCEKLDFKTIVPELVIKPIIHPFRDRKVEVITDDDIILLRQWEEVRDSVWESVWDSVGKSVWDSVEDLVGDLVGDSVGESVWESVGKSVWESVWESVWAYMSSFFDIKYKCDFTPAIKLWEKGIVPSYDGKIWRLHTCEGVLWEGDKKARGGGNETKEKGGLLVSST